MAHTLLHAFSHATYPKLMPTANTYTCPHKTACLPWPHNMLPATHRPSPVPPTISDKRPALHFSSKQATHLQACRQCQSAAWYQANLKMPAAHGPDTFRCAANAQH